MKVLALILISVIGFASSVPAEPYPWLASTVIRQTAIRAKIGQLGLGARVNLTALHGRHYHGYITDVTDHSIEVTDSKTLRARSFEFSAVERISGRPLPDASDPIRNRMLRVISRAISRLGLLP